MKNFIYEFFDFYDRNTSLIWLLIFSSIVIGGLSFVAHNAPEWVRSECSEMCTMMRYKSVGFTSYGCVCEDTNGARIILKDEPHSSPVIVPIVIPSR